MVKPAFFCYPISVNEWNQITDALQIVGDRLKHARDGLAKAWAKLHLRLPSVGMWV